MTSAIIERQARDETHFHDLCVSLFDGDAQWRPALLIKGVDVGSVVDELLLDAATGNGM